MLSLRSISRERIVSPPANLGAQDPSRLTSLRMTPKTNRKRRTLRPCGNIDICETSNQRNHGQAISRICYL
jgi:hypothetical protein